MKKLLAIALASCLTSLCLAQAAVTTNEMYAVTNKTKKVQKKKLIFEKQDKKSNFETKFSMSIIERDRISPEYTGLPIAQVVDSIEKLSDQVKGEFESTTDFNSRKAAALSGKFMGDLSVDDTYAFTVPVVKMTSYSSGLKYDFNADTSKLSLFALAYSKSMNGIGAPNYLTSPRQSNGLDQFDLDFKVNSTNIYQASNAYGASVSVTNTVTTILGIAANKISFLTYERESYDYTNPTPSVQLNIDNTKAARELPALKAIVVIKLNEPYIAYDYMHSKPTIDKPTEYASQGKYLTGNVLGIVFYSGLTGEVFARLPDTFGKPKLEPQSKDQ